MADSAPGAGPAAGCVVRSTPEMAMINAANSRLTESQSRALVAQPLGQRRPPDEQTGDRKHGECQQKLDAEHRLIPARHHQLVVVLDGNEIIEPGDEQDGDRRHHDFRPSPPRRRVKCLAGLGSEHAGGGQNDQQGKNRSSHGRRRGHDVQPPRDQTHHFGNRHPTPPVLILRI